ncbi:MAG: PIN domain-containing protein [Nitrospirae bacterium]|nr:PIN domain-containing protein [Nitrospirota bacterium]MBI3351915.1 PIN domain-containing protein [Nitrospirota bacterium]
MQKNLKNFEGKEAIFVDANIFLHHAFDSNSVSIDFLNKVELFNLKVYTSALVLEEVSFKLLMQSASNFLHKVTMPGVKTLLRDSKKRKEILHPVEEYMRYILLLKESGMGIIELKDSDIIGAVQQARAYGLITADAAHLAVMERKGIHHIATADNDFKAIPSLCLWTPLA